MSYTFTPAEQDQILDALFQCTDLTWDAAGQEYRAEHRDCDL